MNPNHLKHQYLQNHKDEIIAMYRNDMPVKDILKKYGIGHDCLRINLRSWGILKRFNYDVKITKSELSPALLARRKLNSTINKQNMRRVIMEDTPEDKRLIHQVCQMAIRG